MRLTSPLLLVAAVVTQYVAAAPKPQSEVVNSSTVTSVATRTTSLSASGTSTSISSVPTDTTVDACGRLGILARSVRNTPLTVPAQAAWDCLQAVPFDEATAVTWLDSLRPYIRWQSTLAYLKNPPKGYLSPAWDVIGELDNIASKARNGSYSNQYRFEFDIYNLFTKAYDGHFVYLPNLVTSIFSFARPFALVSISSDGKAVPKPYVYKDVILSHNDSNFKPSAVSQIDGVNVITWLGNFSDNSPYHDPDSRWNNMFLELAAVQLGEGGSGPGTVSGGGRGDIIYPNATTTLTFENGTRTTFTNTARLLVSFTTINSTQDLYRRYVNPTAIPLTSSASRPLTPGPGFPQPVLRAIGNLASGYYLNETGYQDVAVLSLPSFQATTDSYNVSAAFLSRARAAGKTKLIIDLSANGGGSILYGFQLFVLLFPNIFPYQGTQFRATQTADIIGQTVSDFSNGTSNTPVNATGFDRTVFSAFFNGGTPFPYASDVDKDYKAFPSWPAKFGPVPHNGDNFTNIIRYNFSQPAIYVNATQIAGGRKTPLFDPENVILITDGLCGSTCSNFLEYMTQQAGVKTVTVGGRPTNNGSVQVTGSTRGANSYSWILPQSYAALAYNITQRYKGAAQALNLFLNTEIGQYIGVGGTDPRLPFKRGGGYSNSVNFRDFIRVNETTPLQFIYQASDCRIYWTADMTVDITAVWKEVYDVTWGDGECVAGEIEYGQTAKKKRSVKSAGERMERRRLARREISNEEYEALAESVNMWNVHAMDISGDGVEMQ